MEIIINFWDPETKKIMNKANAVAFGISHRLVSKIFMFIAY